jgi:protein O-mannosyl-transferase
LRETRILKLSDRSHKEKSGKLEPSPSQTVLQSAGVRETSEPAKQPFMPFSALCLTFLVFLLAAVAVHYAGFNSPMIYDSKAWINDKASVFSSHDVLEVVRICPGRPLLMLTFYVNYLAHGMNPLYFRLFNAVLLATTGLMLAWMIFLVLRTQERAAEASENQHLWIGVFSGLLFVVHPLQSLVVLYVWQRGALLGCLFYFAAFAAYVGGRSGRFRRELHAYILTGMLLLAGLASKENLGTLPLMLVLAELILFRQDLKALARRVACIALIAAPAAFIYSVVVGRLHGATAVHPPGFFVRLHANYMDSGLSPLQVCLSECRVLFSYISSILAPFLSGTPLIRVEAVSNSLLDPPTTLPACLGVLVLLAVSAVSARKKPLLAFGTLFVLITFSLESLAVAQFLFFGFRAILPMAGVLLIVASVLPALLRYCRKTIPERSFATFIGLISIIPIIGFAAVTWSQARAWNPLRFWECAFSALPPFSDKVETNPYVSVLMNYGAVLADSGQYDKATRVLVKAVRIGCGIERPDETPFTATDHTRHVGPDLEGLPARPCPGMHHDYYTAYNHLGMVLSAQGKPQDAIECYRAAIELKPDAADVYNNWGEATLKLGNTAEAVGLFRSALDLQPAHAVATNNLGEGLLRSGKPEEAMKLFQKAIELQPNYGGAFNNLGNAVLASGRATEAIELFRKGIAVTADSPELHNNLGAALFRRGYLAQALEEFRTAVHLRPEFAKARVNLGMVALKLGNTPEALDNLNKAIDTNPRLSLAYVYRGQARELSGHMDLALHDYARAIETDPRLVQAHYSLARAKVKLNDPVSAISHYRSVLQIDPRHYGAHFELGSLFLAASEYPDAVRHLSKAVEIRSDSVEARKSLEIAEQRARE